MFSLPSRLLLALAGLALVAATGYWISIGERTGVVLLLGVVAAALVGGLSLVGGTVADTAPYIPPDAPPPERAATTPGPAATGSVWPMLAAAALAVPLVGIVVGRALIYFGVILVGLTALGWFGKSWTDHPVWTRRFSSRVSNRLVAPVLTPVGAVLLALTIAVSISRVLLAVSKDVAPLIAIGVALLTLVAFFLLAARPRLRSSAMAGLAALAAASVLSAGIAGASQGERETEKHPGPATVKVVARGVNYLESSLKANTAGKEVVIDFHNDDKAIYHNVALYDDRGAKPVPVFNGQGIPGPKRIKYRTTLNAGTYRFQCDFHVNMKGQFIVS